MATTVAIIRAKLQTNRHHRQTNTQLLTGRMPFLTPNRVRALNEKCITFHGLARPKFSWGFPSLSLTAKGSWLPRWRVAKPLIIPVTPVIATVHFSGTTWKNWYPNVKPAPVLLQQKR